MKAIVMVAIVSMAFNAFADVPKKYPNCEPINVPKKNHQGYKMDKGCKNVYVLPPVEGGITYEGFLPSLDIRTCSSKMSRINDLNRRITENEKAAKDLIKAKNKSEKTNKKIVELQRLCDSRRSALVNMQTKERKIEADIDSTKKWLADLEISRAECAANCEQLDQKIQEVKTKIKEIMSVVPEVKYKVREAEYQLSICTNYADTQIEIIRQNDQEYDRAMYDLQAKRDEFLKSLNSDLSELMKTPGAQVTIGLFSRHNALVDEFRKLNEGSGLNFYAIPLQNAVIHFERIEDGVKAGIPVVMRSSIRGLNAPNTDEGTPVEALEFKGSSQAGKAFGEGAGGNMIINLYTACEIMGKGYASSREEQLQEIAHTIKPTVTFNYDVQVSRKISIKYNENHLYQLIKKSARRSSFFRSSSSVHITEKSEAEKWIQVSVDSEDPNAKWVDPDKLALDLRQEFLDSALMRVAKGYLTTAQLEMREPGQVGATAAAKELSEKCPHAYCQYAAVALNIGAAAFGKSTSEANMKRTVSTQESQEISVNETVREFGQQTLTIEKL